ncbi:MAG: lipid-binding SYLF domain-containing protein [Thermoanaerobaculia bacterium]|nr:lipid-binding SYLF domain-containing protein [Thermoanaerobaculia bacterium]
MRTKATVFCTLTALAALAVAAPAAADVDPDRKLRVARTVYQELMATPDKAAPRWMEEEAECIAVIPNVIKGAFFWGGRRGKGVLSCRDGGGWSPPAFVKITGGSFGLQIGGEAADLVLFFRDRRGVESLLTSQVVLGAEAGAAAGPLGRNASAATDGLMRAKIFAYARARGLFAGASIDGSRLAADQGLIRAHYGRRLFPEQILFEGEVGVQGPAAEGFLEVLP